MPPAGLTASSLVRAARRLAGRDPRLAAVVDRIGAPPMWGRPPGFTTLVRIILEQQVSLASGRATHERLRDGVGRVTPRRVLEAGEGRLRGLGLTRQKARYVTALAGAIRSGDLLLGDLPGRTDDDVRSTLCRLPGIGPWTADVYLLMALRRPDVWPNGDLALATAATDVLALERRPTYAELSDLAEAWSPWRAVAARILWHHYLSDRSGA